MDEEKLNAAGDGTSVSTSNVLGSPAVLPQPIDKEALPSSPERSNNESAVPAPETDEEEWVTGLKLTAIVSFITMAAFLMLLDVSIVATVSYFLNQLLEVDIDGLAGGPKNHQ
jgi:hypothetical protein